jgi:hypothetical protein
MNFQAEASRVRLVISQLKLAYPELEDDDDLRADTFEAETDLHSLISRALRIRHEASAHEEGLSLYLSHLTARRDRFRRKGELMKAFIQSLMDAAGQDKITLPEATIFVTKPRESVNVTDVDALPQGTFTVVRVPDKKALKEIMMAGEEVPGAELVLSLAGLTIRTK